MPDTNLKNEPRVVGIVVMALVGFIVGQVLASVLDTVVAAIVGYPGGVTALSGASEPPWWANAFGLAGLWVGFGVAIVYAHRRGQLVPLKGAWRPRRIDVAYVALGVGLQIVVGLAYLPFHFKNMDTPVNHLFGSAHGTSFALLAVMTVLGAPLMEEWLFRGVIFRALDIGMSSRWGRSGTVVAVVVSGFIFAAAHAEWLQLPGLFFLGVVLAVIVKRTQRLLPAMLTHVGFNALTMASLISQRVHH